MAAVHHPAEFQRSASPVAVSIRRTPREIALSGAAGLAVIASGVSGLFLGQAIAAARQPELSVVNEDGGLSEFVVDTAEAIGVVGTSSAAALSLGSLVGIAVAGNRESRRNFEQSRGADPGSVGL